MTRVEVASSVSSAQAGDIVVFRWKEDAAIPGIPKAEFDGSKFSTLQLRQSHGRILHVGLGEKGKVEEDTVRRASGVAVKHLLKIGADEITLRLESWARFAQAAVEGALLAAYKFEEFKAAASRRKNHLKILRLWVPAGDQAQARAKAREGQVLAEAANYTRALGNLPPNVITPVVLAEKARELAKQYRMTCRVWDEEKLRKGKFGGILAVGQGSANPPRMIMLEYRGGRKSAKPIVLVGKAITFDTGGISIKPSDKMDEMKFDKMGGCTVLGAMKAIAQLKLPFPVIGLIASAENMPGSRAYRPGDIISTYDGKTIEVLNTDAEGRVVLADALAYARIHYKPRYMVDFATLTGACVVALGGQRAGLFTNDDKLRHSLTHAGRSTGDLVWELPVGDEYDEMVKSDVAVVKNSAGREGGACTAASFLKTWVEDVPWAHLDIAGTAWTTKGHAGFEHLEKGATGFGVRLIVQALRALA